MLLTTLILEDEQVRVDWLRRKFPDWQITWTKHPDETIAAMQTKQWDLIILDHDLHFPVDSYVGAEPTGFWAAREVPADSVVLVWSINIPAAEQMANAIAERGATPVRIPFTWRDGLEYFLRQFESTHAETKD